MIIDEEFLNQLRRAFDLNLYEVKLWTALLSRGVSTAGELSDMANVPRSRTYDVLESLERKGFVVIQPDKPIKYIAISPRDVLDRVKKRVDMAAQERTNRLANLRESDMLMELHQLYEAGIEPMSPTDFTGALKGRHNIYDHIAMLIKESQRSIDIVTSADGFVRKIRSLRPALEKARARDVKIRIGAPLNDSTKEFVDKISDIAEVRNITNIAARFCIVDRKQLVFMMLSDTETHPTYDLAMWVNTPFFSAALTDMFNKVWREGGAIGASSDMQTERVGIAEARVDIKTEEVDNNVSI